MTNADMIRQMTNEELETVLMCPFESGFWDGYKCKDGLQSDDCADCVGKWLKEPAPEEALP